MQCVLTYLDMSVLSYLLTFRSFAFQQRPIRNPISNIFLLLCDSCQDALDLLQLSLILGDMINICGSSTGRL